MAKDGSVFTKSWVVNLMLDLAGYTSDKDLAKCLAVEPSFGSGAFLLPMIQRLLVSAKDHGHGISEIIGSIRAYEISEQCIIQTRTSLEELFRTYDVEDTDIRACLNAWIHKSDYLLEKDHGTADYVIGNPPYIRSNDICEEKKTAYLDACFTMTPGSDLFVGFYEKGLQSLKPDGVLAYICADRWMHNTYGKHLREYVSTAFSMDTIIVMHDADAFENEVSAYPAITIIKRAAQGEVHYAKALAAFGENHAQKLREWRHGESDNVPYCDCSILETWFSGKALWPLTSPKKLELIRYLESHYPSLEDSTTGTKVGIGVATGSDSVFIVSDPSVVETDRAIPVITSRQLNRKTVETKPLWLVNPWNANEELVNIEGYPKMKEYFEENADVLNKRQIARKSEANAWYRTIDKVHPGLETTRKLLIQDMHARFEPFYDESHYPHGNLYYVISDKWDLEVLGGLLMSSICEMFIDAYGVKMRGGTLRFQAQYLRTIRVPDVDSIPEETKNQLRTAFKTKNYDLADASAMKAYQLKEM